MRTALSLRRRTWLALSVLVGLATAGRVDADTISWKRIGVPRVPPATWLGHPARAPKIAACDDGRLYRVDFDRSVWVYTAGDEVPMTADGWRRVTTLRSDPRSISSGMNKLYVYTGDGMLERNDAEGDRVAWTRVGRPPEALGIVAVTTIAGAACYAVAYGKVGPPFGARRVLWSPSGDDLSWRWVDDACVTQIAAASENEVFALSYFDVLGKCDVSNPTLPKHLLYINHGYGLASYWRNVTNITYRGSGPEQIREIASANPNVIYAVDGQHALWVGRVTRVMRPVTLSSSEFDRFMRLFVLPLTSLRLHRETATFTPGRFLQGQGLTRATFPIPPITVGGIGVHINDATTSNITVTLGPDRVEISVAFEEEGPEVLVDSSWVPDFDIVNFSLTAELVPRLDEWGDRVMVLDNFHFKGELKPRGLLLVAYRQSTVRRRIEEAVGPMLAELISAPATEAGLRQALVGYASGLPPRQTWEGIAFSSLTIGRTMEGSELRFTAER